MQLEYAYKISVIGPDTYLGETKDKLLRQKCKYDTNKKLIRFIKMYLSSDKRYS